MLTYAKDLSLKQIGFVIIFLDENHRSLDLTREELLKSIPKILPLLNIDSLLSLKDFYTMKEDGYEVSDKQFSNILEEIRNRHPEFEKINYDSLDRSEKSEFLNDFKEDVSPLSSFFLISVAALSDKQLTRDKVEKLFNISNYFSIQKEDALGVLRSVSEHNNEILELVSSMSTHTRVLSYLYTVRLMLENGLEIFEEEREFLKNVKESYNLKFDKTDFWKNYLGIMSNFDHYYEDLIGERSKARIGAVHGCMNFVNEKDGPALAKVLTVKREEGLDEVLDELNISNDNLVNILENFDDEKIKVLYRKLTTKECLYIFVNYLTKCMRDNTFEPIEIRLTKVLASEIKARGEKVEDGDIFYLTFLRLVMVSEAFRKINDGDFVREMNKFLKNATNTLVPIRMMFYTVETDLNSKDIYLTKDELKSVAELLEIPDEQTDAIISDCINDKTPSAQKHRLLMSLMQVEFLLENKKLPESLTKKIMKIIDGINPPEDYEDNAIVYFMLKGMYSDKKIDQKEIDYFTSVIKRIDASDEVVETFMNYLYLETGIEPEQTTAVKYREDWRD